MSGVIAQRNACAANNFLATSQPRSSSRTDFCLTEAQPSGLTHAVCHSVEFGSRVSTLTNCIHGLNAPVAFDTPGLAEDRRTPSPFITNRSSKVLGVFSTEEKSCMLLVEKSRIDLCDSSPSWCHEEKERVAA